MGAPIYPTIVLSSQDDLLDDCNICNGQMTGGYVIDSIPTINLFYCASCEGEDSPSHIYPVGIEGELLMSIALARIAKINNRKSTRINKEKK